MTDTKTDTPSISALPSDTHSLAAEAGEEEPPSTVMMRKPEESPSVIYLTRFLFVLAAICLVALLAYIATRIFMAAGLPSDGGDSGGTENTLPPPPPQTFASVVIPYDPRPPSVEFVWTAVPSKTIQSVMTIEFNTSRISVVTINTRALLNQWVFDLSRGIVYQPGLCREPLVPNEPIYDVLQWGGQIWLTTPTQPTAVTSVPVLLPTTASFLFDLPVLQHEPLIVGCRFLNHSQYYGIGNSSQSCSSPSFADCVTAVEFVWLKD